MNTDVRFTSVYFILSPGNKKFRGIRQSQLKEACNKNQYLILYARISKEIIEK
jgi:hypothetical protein